MQNDKKDNLRFTLRMNPCDPVQRRAAQILNGKGRHISEFVAQAITEKADKAGPMYTPQQQTPSNAGAEPKQEKSADDKLNAMIEGLGDFKPN
jgi:hypothetical protein